MGAAKNPVKKDAKAFVEQVRGTVRSKKFGNKVREGRLRLKFWTCPEERYWIHWTKDRHRRLMNAVEKNIEMVGVTLEEAERHPL